MRRRQLPRPLSRAAARRRGRWGLGSSRGRGCSRPVGRLLGRGGGGGMGGPPRAPGRRPRGRRRRPGGQAGRRARQRHQARRARGLGRRSRSSRSRWRSRCWCRCCGGGLRMRRCPARWCWSGAPAAAPAAARQTLRTPQRGRPRGESSHRHSSSHRSRYSSSQVNSSSHQMSSSQPREGRAAQQARRGLHQTRRPPPTPCLRPGSRGPRARCAGGAPGAQLRCCWCRQQLGQGSAAATLAAAVTAPPAHRVVAAPLVLARLAACWCAMWGRRRGMVPPGAPPWPA
jgi:hypothetical protein